MKLNLFILFFSFNCYAKIIHPKKESRAGVTPEKEIVLNSVYEEIFKRVKHLKIISPNEVIEENQSGSINKGERGRLVIERLKQKNRERLARMRGQDPSTVKSGKDIVLKQKNENKQLIKSINEQRKIQEDNYADIPLSLRRSKKWQESAKRELDIIKQRVLISHNKWKDKYIEELKQLALKQNEFAGRSKDYKRAVTDIPLILPEKKKHVKKEIEIRIDKEALVVSNAFKIKIKDQSLRPTCSAFAGVRLMETLLAQNSYDWDLSEQYFYWASKSDCQNQKCTSKGSWVGHGITYENETKEPSIPLESDCPYNPFNELNNETQLPLKKSCSKGKAGVEKFSYHDSLDSVITQLKKGKAVIASIKLSANFYKNQGLILNSEKNIGGEKDGHSGGHAVVFIGYIKLPKALNEGAVCFLTANSWGEGWGINGHSCLSEKWVLEHRKNNPFVTIDALKII